MRSLTQIVCLSYQWYVRCIMSDLSPKVRIPPNRVMHELGLFIICPSPYRRPEPLLLVSNPHHEFSNLSPSTSPTQTQYCHSEWTNIAHPELCHCADLGPARPYSRHAYPVDPHVYVSHGEKETETSRGVTGPGVLIVELSRDGLQQQLCLPSYR